MSQHGNSLYMKANKVTGRPRKSKDYGSDRVCAQEDCSQIMSRYNHNEHCFQHAPKRMPRVRGHELVGSRKKKDKK